MTFTVKCFCGTVVQTDDEESLIAQVSDHSRAWPGCCRRSQRDQGGGPTVLSQGKLWPCRLAKPFDKPWL